MSVCEPQSGSVERIRSNPSGPSGPQIIPQRQPRPVRLLQELVAFGRKKRVWQQDRELLLAGAIEEPQAPGCRRARSTEPAVEFGASGFPAPSERQRRRIIACSPRRSDAQMKVRRAEGDSQIAVQ